MEVGRGVVSEWSHSTEMTPGGGGSGVVSEWSYNTEMTPGGGGRGRGGGGGL